MDALFEKLERLSSPLGSLLDAALNRLVPHTSAAACGGRVFCGSPGCSFRCGNGHLAQVFLYAPTERDCDVGINITRCLGPCNC